MIAEEAEWGIGLMPNSNLARFVTSTGCSPELKANVHRTDRCAAETSAKPTIELL
jgi:hypothetical protein